MKTRKALSLALTLVLCFSLLSTAALAAEYTITQVVPFQYDEIQWFSDGLACVRRDGKWGVINITGQEIIPCRYDAVRNNYAPFSDGLAAVRIGDDETGKWGYVNTAGQEVIPCIYDDAWSFEQGLASVQLDGKWGYIDHAGQTVLPCTLEYDFVGGFYEGLAQVGVSANKTVPWALTYGFIDASGREIIPCQYTSVTDFSEGIAVVSITDLSGATKYGCIDTTGKEVVPCRYDGPMSFYDGTAMVVRDGKYGVIDTQGRETIPCQYDEIIEHFASNLLLVRLNDRWGYMDTAGHELTPCQFEFCPTNIALDDPSGRVMLASIKDTEGNEKWGLLSLTVTGTAYVSTQTVNVDDKPVEFQCYALKDENGNPTNYIKLRDLAYILNGTPAQFNLGWDGSVSITTNTAYQANGSELKTPFSGNRTYSEATSPTRINGWPVDLAAITLSDENGGGYTYYKLRDLAEVLNFNVTWKQGTGIILETGKPYNPAG